MSGTSSHGSCPSADPVTQYAWSVARDGRPAGKWHRLACERHLRDLEASTLGQNEWVFRTDLVTRAVGIFALFRHYKGREWAGRPVVLEPWQTFIVGSLMGWLHRETKLRRFRNAFIELPRGQGKSTLAGGMLVLLTFFDGEAGAEGYSYATKKDQARICFQAARQMVLRSPALKEHIEVQKHNLHSTATESKLEPLGADADTLDGLRPNIAVGDEVHKQKAQEVTEVIESGMGTRGQPMLFEITTAGTDDTSVYGQHFLLSTRVLEETVPLPEWFAFIAAADQEDDWTQEATWVKANPNYGISVKPEFLRKEARKAIANPAEQAKFRRLYLGQKVQSVDSYFSVDDWRACPGLPAEAELRAYTCWLGFDLSSTTDITAAVLLWQLPNGELAMKPTFWMPEDSLEERGHQDRMPYVQWREEQWLRTTPGRTIDRQTVRRQLVELARAWKIAELCADPWQMHELGPQLAEEDKVPVAFVPQRFEKLSEPMKVLQGRVIERRVRHDHNPLMTVMVGNVTPRFDDRGNVMPSKKKSRGRIDGVQALLNVVAQLPTSKPPSYQMFFVGGKPS